LVLEGQVLAFSLRNFSAGRGSYNWVIIWIRGDAMELKVRKIGNGYGVLLPKQLLEEMRVAENSVLNVEKVEGVYQMTPLDGQFSRQVEAFLRTEPLHRNSYRELAK